MVRRFWPGWILGFVLGLTTQLAAQERGPPPRVELRENYPNPFFPTTTIPFFIHPDICTRGHQPNVSLKIYNVLVQVVAIPKLQNATGERLDNLKLLCGEHEAFWDGKYGDSDRELTAGVYYYQLSVDGQRYTRKMIARK